MCSLSVSVCCTLCVFNKYIATVRSPRNRDYSPRRVTLGAYSRNGKWQEMSIQAKDTCKRCDEFVGVLGLAIKGKINPFYSSSKI